MAIAVVHQLLQVMKSIGLFQLKLVPWIFQKLQISQLLPLQQKAIMGHTIEEQGYSYGIVPEKETIAVKMPVFSFEKIKGAEISLGLK